MWPGGCLKLEVSTGKVLCSSVYNTRIERLWREVRRVAIHQFITLFNYLEDESLLDPMDNVHLFALHYVYLGRINTFLAEFSMQ